MATTATGNLVPFTADPIRHQAGYADAMAHRIVHLGLRATDSGLFDPKRIDDALDAYEMMMDGQSDHQFFDRTDDERRQRRQNRARRDVAEFTYPRPPVGTYLVTSPMRMVHGSEVLAASNDREAIDAAAAWAREHDEPVAWLYRDEPYATVHWTVTLDGPQGDYDAVLQD